MQCINVLQRESVSVHFLLQRSRLAELLLKAGRIRWLIGLPATSIKQQATESKREPKFIIPQKVCQSNQAHAGHVHRARHKADRLDRRAEAALSGYLYVLDSSVWVCEEAACLVPTVYQALLTIAVLGIGRRIHTIEETVFFMR
ncbi:TPA: hypothetical protein ACH3X2_013521 [Trebouxia sp. C0005]